MELKFHRNKKGQMQSIDAVLALASFAILLIFMINIWADLRQQSQYSVSISRLETAANAIADELVNSPGTPYSWETNPSSALSLGLASSPGVLSLAKVSNFSSLTYGSAKTLLGVDKNFYVVVSNNSWSALYTLGNSAAQTNSSVGITRLATLNGQIVKVRVVVYE